MSKTTVILLMLFLLIPLAAQAELRSIEVEQQKPFLQNLHWENIEGIPFWVSGERPRRKTFRGEHYVTLAPGSFTSIRLPPFEMLRILRRDGNAITKDSFEISRSNGSGMSLTLKPELEDSKSELIYAPMMSKENIIHIHRPGNSDKSIDLIIYISRHDIWYKTNPYRHLINLEFPAIRIQRRNQAKGKQFWLLDDRPIKIDVHGPTNIRIDQRYRYQPYHASSKQRYLLKYRLNEEAWIDQWVQTRAEAFHPLRLNNKPALLGELEQHFLHIPEGKHTLYLKTDDEIYVRLYKQAFPDYLSSMNAIKVDKDSLQRSNQAQFDLKQAQTRLNHDLKDNRYRETALLATTQFEQAIHTLTRPSSALKNLDKIRNQQTFFRHLLPERYDSTTPQFYWFDNPTLLSLTQQNRRRLVAQQHQRDALHSMTQGRFHTLTTIPLNYPLPERQASSTLRLLVNYSNLLAPQTLWLQFDDDAPIKIVANPAYSASKAQWLPSKALIALKHLSAVHQQQTSATLDGVFSLSHHPAPLIKGASLETELPAKTRNIRIWLQASTNNKDNSNTLSIALQYQAASPYRLTESQYLKTWDSLIQTEAPLQLVQRLLTKDLNHLAPMEAQIANHWTTLRRLLMSRRNQFIEDLERPLFKTIIDESLAATSLHRAQYAEQRQEWMAALNHWRSAMRHSPESQHTLPALGQIKALKQLGEPFVAQRMLKGFYLFSNNPRLKQAAFKQLMLDYTETQNQGAIQSLLAYAILENPTYEIVTELVKQLHNEHRHSMALWLLLAFSPSKQIDDLLLASSYKMNWQQVFHRVLQRTDAQTAAIWQGYQAQATGDYERALHYWASAGQTGLQLAQHLINGQYIRQALPLHPKEALQAWQNWEIQHPGRWHWYNAPDTNIATAGTATLYNKERDLVSSAFISDENSSVKFRLYGPAQLRFNIRPIHPSHSGLPISGWIKLIHKDQLHVLPFDTNRPNPKFEWVNQKTALIGELETLEYAIGPGIHEIELTGNQHTLLVNALIYRPQHRLAVLPLLTPETQVALTQAHNHATVSPLLCDKTVPNILLNHCQQWRKQPLPQHALNTQLQQQPPLRTVVLSRLPLDTTTPLSSFSSNNNLRQQLLYWRWQAENYPSRIVEANAQIKKLRLSAPGNINIKAGSTPLTRLMRWTNITNVQESAGLRSKTVSGWSPESIRGRINRILFNITEANTQIITPTSPLGVVMHNTQATQIKASLTLNTLPFTTINKTQLRIALNDDAPQFIELSREQPFQEIERQVPEGIHTLHINYASDADIQSGQSVQIRLWERPLSNKQALYTPLLHERMRNYHVASRHEPVVLKLKGPGLLRSDQLIRDQLNQQFHLLEPGWQSLTFTTPFEARHALYRFHLNVLDDNTEDKDTFSNIALQSIPWLKIENKAFIQSDWLTAFDGQPLNNQEDGTWTAGISYNERFLIDEASTNNDSERFLETFAEHRHYDAYRQSYYQGRLLARQRQHGKMTLGVSGRWHHQPNQHSWRAAISSSLLLQRPNNRDTEWIFNWRGEIAQKRPFDFAAQHQPYVAIFARLLSIRSLGDYSRAELDQDIFSDYKNRHRHGVILGDRLSYRPWLDSEWYGHIAMRSNEDLNPLNYDSLSVSTGWKQLLKHLQLDGRLGVRRYQADEDRSKALTRKQLRLSASWNHWNNALRRWQIQFHIHRDLDRAVNSYQISLKWHAGSGRGLRDFRPSEEPFKTIRSHRHSVFNIRPDAREVKYD